MGPAFHYQAFAMMSIACAVFLWPLYLLNRHQPAMRPWLLASICLPMGPLLLPLQLEGYIWWGVTFANHCLMLWSILTLTGIMLYSGISWRRVWRFVLLVFLCVSVPFNFFTWVDYDTRARIIIYSLMYIVVYSVAAIVVWRRFGLRSGRYGVNLLLAMSAMMVLIMLARLLGVLTDTTFDSIMEGRLINLAVSSVGYFVAYGLVLSYALLLQEDRQLELQLLQRQAQHNAGIKSRFLATLSHELRTPLNAIAGIAEGMQLRRPEPGIRQDCSAIIDHAMNLSQLAREVLVQSEQEHSEARSAQQAVVLDNWLRCLLAGLQPLVQRPNVRLKLDCPHSLGCRQIDSVRLRQVLTNLISNAIKYTEQGEVVLSVKAQEQHKVEFAVMDTGKGIATTDMQRLLQPFTRAEDVRGSDGAGLGLTLTQQWLRQLGSRLQCDSQLGKGSRFSFTLRLPHVDQPEVEFEVPLYEPLAVLVVEDVVLNRDLLTGQLQQLGHWVSSVGSLTEARQYCRSHYIDVIILDMNLPDGDGLSLLPWLQQEQRHIAVIPFTADNSPVRQQQLQQAGLSTTLTKPLTLPALAAALRPLQQQVEQPIVDLTVLQQSQRYIPADIWPQQLEQALAALQGCLPLTADSEDERSRLHKIASQSSSLGLARLMTLALNLLDQSGPIQSWQRHHLQRLLQFSIERLREHTFAASDSTDANPIA
ncbi:hypothetical protein GCM10011297_23330 [Bacterioplanes sanyensis]|uniref:hybrid sensor histidine kinase/response regulator n=1 Tax=Bacterioplanes sanyensis TaxID=1249553 RepID=UPI00167A6CB0|nr:ATP-binding protein [Bacterioplanes sanyensis]GGY49692.1 hypothetical protein GCM10011297_23330 [Bacterioplanes sanyensis]